MSFPVKKAIKAKTIAVRSKAYGIPGKLVDGNDVFAVSDAVEAAIKRARKGKGPTLIECQTYRWKGHSKSDSGVYRTQEEIDSWKEKCPIERFREKLIEGNLLTPEQAEEIDQEAKKDIEEATEFAMDSQEPKPQDIEEDVYA
jgi:pyruvate dehydrogenase E1 component alpha subunit